MAFAVHAEAPQWHTQCMQKHHNGIHSACRSTTMAYTVRAEAPQWHTQCMQKPYNGIHSACRRSSPDAGLYSHTNTVSAEAATTCVLVMVRHSGSTVVALESTGVPMASQRMMLHCPVSSPLVTRMQCCPAACTYGQPASNCTAL